MESEFKGLYNIKMWELPKVLTPLELAMLLTQESNSSDTDIMLDNMLEYFVEKELYSYVCVIRDEINHRK